MTFTNAVANELKKRLIEVLFESISDDKKFQDNKEKYFKDYPIKDEEIKYRCKKALIHILHHYTDLSLQTLDSFFNRVLKGFAKELNYSIAYEISPEADEYYKQSSDVYLDSIDKTQDDKFKVLYEYILLQKKENNEKFKVNDLIHELIGTLKNLSEKELKKEEIEQQKKLLTNFKEQELKQIINKHQNQLNKSIETFDEKIREYIVQVGEKNDYYQLVNGKLEITKKSKINKNRFRSLCSLYENPFEKFEKIDWDKDWFNTGASEQDKENIQSIHEKHEEEYNFLVRYKKNINHIKSIVDKVSITKIALELLEILRDIKAEENIVFFSDFTREISQLIQTEPVEFVFERVGARYRNFLIDEFQDTSELQFKSIFPLIHNAMADGNANYIVGDPKQSIYGWRNANVEQFTQLYYHKKINTDIEQIDNDIKNFEDRIVPQPLKYNYRSTKDIVEFNNHIFNGLQYTDPREKQEFLLIQEVYENASQCTKSKEEGYVEIIEYQAENGLSNKEKRFEQFTKDVLDKIKECISLGYKQRDICILLRTNKEISDFIQTLQGKEIGNGEKLKFISPEGLLIYKSEEVSFIVSFLKLLINRKDKIANALCRRYMNKDKQFIPDEENDFISNYQSDNTYKKIFSDISKQSIYQLILNIIEYFNLPFSPAVEKLLEIVNQFTITYKDRGNTIKDFLNFWDENAKYFSMSVNSNDDAVQIMTIHKSKGLEFPVVIFNLNFENKGQSYWYKIPENKPVALPSQPIYNIQQDNITAFSGLMLYLDTSEIEMFDEETANYLGGKEHLEHINLIYVACTRAIHRLYVFSHTKNDYYNEIIHPKIQSFKKNQIKEDDKNIIIYHYGNKDKKAPETKHSEKDKFSELDLTGITLQNNPNIFIAHPAGIHSDENIDIGLKLHKVLEYFDFNEKHIDYAVGKAIAKGDISILEKTKMKHLLQKLITQKELQEFINPQNIQEILSEQSFYIYDKTETTTELRPDKIIITKNKMAVVLDFKTGAKDERHAQQVKKYMNALQYVYPDIKETKGFLVYISANMEQNNNEAGIDVQSVE